MGAASAPLWSPTMSEWNPIETAPENTDVLVVRGDKNHDYGVDRFEWKTRSEERLVREQGNRRTYETEEWKEQEWSNGWGWTHWMPLPAPPDSPDEPSPNQAMGAGQGADETKSATEPVRRPVW